MNDFRTQIREDIKEYQLRYPNISNIEKDEWAFNYWILDKFFYEDEELIEDKIIDYNDMGVDAYEIYEDTKELYLIQNKYYNDSSKLSAEYVKNDFLLRPITALEMVHIVNRWKFRISLANIKNTLILQYICKFM